MAVDGIVSRVEHLIRLEKFSEARKAIEHGLHEEPENRELLLCAAEIDFLTGHAKVEERIAWLVGRFPDWSRPHYLRARLLAEREDSDGAIRSIQTAISLFPIEPEYLARLGQYLLLQRRFRESLEATDRSLAYDPGHVLALTVRSRALYGLSRWDEAAAAYQLAVSTEPDNPYSHLNYAKYLEVIGDHKRAAYHFQSALRLLPTMPGLPQALIAAYKRESAGYRQFEALFNWIRKRHREVIMILLVSLWIGTSALKFTLPAHLSAKYMLIALASVGWVTGFIVMGDILANWLLRAPDRSALLDRYAWKMTYLITGLYALGTMAAIGYVVTGTAEFLVAFVYSALVLVPVMAITEDASLARRLRTPFVTLMMVAVLGIVATHLDFIPNVAHLFYIVVFTRVCVVIYRWKVDK